MIHQQHTSSIGYIISKQKWTKQQRNPRRRELRESLHTSKALTKCSVCLALALMMAFRSSYALASGRPVELSDPIVPASHRGASTTLHQEVPEERRLSSWNDRSDETTINNDENSGEISTKTLETKPRLPQRVRIAPFDLLLAPTPIQLQRADEDLLLVELQELIILFMKTQFDNQNDKGSSGSSSTTSKTGAYATLEYVLFSDIEQNGWFQGHNGSEDPPRTVLRFNGGVASFIGPDIPSEWEVNEWVESSINGLFAPALKETPYNYVELAQYMVIEDSTVAVQPGDIIVNVPSYSTRSPQPDQQTSREPSPRGISNVLSSGGNGTTGDEGGEVPLFHVLLSLLVAFAVVAVILALWIRRNNRAVRVLCLSSKEQEEIVDFTDDAPISIKHETGNKRQTVGDRDSEDGEYSLRKDSLIIVEDDLHNQISVATQCPVDEASLEQSTTSEFTIPTVSALSFRNPNPFKKGLVSQESFQKERKTYLSKDMLGSSWSGKPPSFQYGRRHDESVLKPSYFSAANEWDYMAKMAAVSESYENQLSDEESEGPRPFRFEQAHEHGEVANIPDGLYVISSPGSQKEGRNVVRKPNGNRKAQSDIV